MTFVAEMIVEWAATGNMEADERAKNEFGSTYNNKSPSGR